MSERGRSPDFGAPPLAALRAQLPTFVEWVGTGRRRAGYGTAAAPLSWAGAGRAVAMPHCGPSTRTVGVAESDGLVENISSP